MTNAIPMIGKKFTRLLVLKRIGRTRSRLVTYLCRCDCGVEKEIDGSSLRRGHTLSCGCLGRERTAQMLLRRNFRHGFRFTRVYRIWCVMIQRCTNPNFAKYQSYGARGIKVCETWRTSFGNFLRDMGPCPDGMSIHRKDNDGDYEPSNCRWATAKEQARNKRNNRPVSFGGKTMLVPEWAEHLGVSAGTLRMRLHRKWPLERALSK